MDRSVFNSFTEKRRSVFSPEIPLEHSTISVPPYSTMNCAVGEFTQNYRARLATEWSPLFVNRPDPPLLVQNSEIHHKHVGHQPNYGGYIPGAKFRCGKTYGEDTKDAKKWIRGDFS